MSRFASPRYRALAAIDGLAGEKGVRRNADLVEAEKKGDLHHHEGGEVAQGEPRSDDASQAAPLGPLLLHPPHALHRSAHVQDGAQAALWVHDNGQQHATRDAVVVGRDEHVERVGEADDEDEHDAGRGP